MTAPIQARAGGDTAAEVRGHIRGSTLMLAGRIAALAVTFLTQVLVVRYLSKEDFGALSYALSVVALLQPFLTLGLDLADTRFFALYDERDDRPRLAGLLALEVSVVVALGAVVVVTVVGLRGALTGSLGDVPSAETLLALLIALSPLQALDSVILDLFALFAGARYVFIRRFVLAPGLRLCAVVVVMTVHAGVTPLAVGYLLAALAGTVVYVPLLGHLLGRIRVTDAVRNRQVVVPAREVLGFALPLLSTSIVITVSTTLGAIVLGHTGTPSQVAAFRAVQPIAVLVMLVQTSFAILFQPAAARAHARGDRAGLAHLYWQTSGWLAVLTFPIAATAICFATPLVTTLLGSRYADSATYLAILAGASYLQTASGFNGATLQVVGRVRYVVVSNVAVLAVAVAANALLVPAAGALGAAVAAAITVALHNVFKQLGLPRAGIPAFDRDYGGMVAWLGGGLAVLGVLASLVAVPLVPAVALVALCSLVILRANRRRLDLASTFPELARVRLLRMVLGA